MLGVMSPPCLMTLQAYTWTSAALSSTCGILQVPYYDNMRTLTYPGFRCRVICFDISGPEALDRVLKKWQGETREFCFNAKVVLVGCKLNMQMDLATPREQSKQQCIPVTHQQGTALAKEVRACPPWSASLGPWRCLPCGHSGLPGLWP